MRKTVILLALLLLSSDIVLCQGFYNRNRNRNLILMAGTGTTHYYGDLAKNGDHGNIRPNFSVGARYNFYRWFSFGSDITWFMLVGDDKTDPGKEVRNLSFQSHNFELNALLYVSLFEEDRRFYLRPLINPYIYGGVGFVNFNPTTKLDGERHALRPLQTEGKKYGSFTTSFPIGAGVKFRVNPFINLAIDGGYRIVMTDYLDDVSSGVYPHPSTFDDEIARLLSDRTWETLPDDEPTWAEQGKNFRGDPKNNDGYFIFNLKIEYYFTELGRSSSYRGRIKGGNTRRMKPPRNRTNRHINRRRY